MTPRRALLETVYLSSLALWLGLIVMTGVIAATVFPMMADMEPRLGAYAKYEGDHSMIAAGRVANRAFVLSSIGEGLCLIAAVTSLVFLTMHKHLTYVAAGARWATTVVLLCILGYSVLILRPRMGANVGQFWEAAAAGDSTRAEAFRGAFSADHGPASATLGITAVALLIALAVTAWTLTREAVVVKVSSGAGPAPKSAGAGVQSTPPVAGTTASKPASTV
jgi:hypothetical protein